jgi:hypothetical protein
MGMKISYPCGKKTFIYDKTYSFYFSQLAAVIFNQATGNNNFGLRVLLNTAPDGCAGFLIGVGGNRAGINKVYIGFPGRPASLLKAMLKETLSYALGIILVYLAA